MRPLGVHRWLLWAAVTSALVPLSATADSDTRSWLLRMKAAASGLNYEGTLVFSAGGAISSSRVWHYRVGENTFERLEAQDGRQQRIFRHNDEVRTVWPQSGTAVVERREMLAAWSTTPQAVDPRAADVYELRQEGTGRVAGRDAAVLMLWPRDGLRFAQRLWADQATGLMLRADVIGPTGGLVESSAFSTIELGVKAQPEGVLQAMKQDAGLRIVRPAQRRTSLEDEGWQLARPVAGFVLAGCMRRGLEQVSGESTPMLQVVFTDGLTHVSLFVESFNPERHRSEKQAQMGATHTLTRRSGDYWLTVVGDVPPAALKQFAEALDRRR